MTGAERSSAPQILLVDDNPTNLQVLYQTLDGQGYRLLAAKSGKDALAIAERAMPDLIMLDVMMPEMDGFETCARLKAHPRTKEAAVIFLSALTDPNDKVRGLELGAVDFVNKPFQAPEVLARVRTHVRIRELDKQLRKRNDELEHELKVAQELANEARDRTDGVLLGQSASAARLRQDVESAAATDDTLLISGPPGSDHEAVARAVHHRSARAERPIIYVNCLSAPTGAPLFGEGVSAGSGMESKLRLAEGGTLYLEGIQHLTPDWQRRLAATLDSLHGLRRTPGTTPPDVRVIVSTTRPIDDELAAGSVLPELHRTCLLTIDLPPLRVRSDDLPTLIRFFLQRQAEQADRPLPLVPDELLDRLKSYRWPGNLRELRSVIECALATSSPQQLEVSDHLLDDSVRVGSYRLLERLGTGGMGEVWLARHQLLARPAAIKLVRQTPGAGEENREIRQRFEREAHAIAQLQSPYTVQLYDFGVTDNGTFYYVMERLLGTDLQRMIERFGPLQPSRVVYLLKQACRSLTEAHTLGLVHRDIKPANLFVSRLGHEYDFLKVLDFGVVWRRRDETVLQVTAAGTVLGTPGFLAPELATGETVFDGRADIYALGCVGFWLLTGRLPFEANDVMSMLIHHTRTTPTAPSRFAEERIPPALDRVILKCLEKLPADRFATVDQLAEQLDAVPFSEPWDQRQARNWWEQHAPDLVGSAT